MEKQCLREPMLVDIKSLQAMTDLSKNKAMELGKNAGAVVNLGIRRTLYNVEKIKAYIDSNTEGGSNDS